MWLLLLPSRGHEWANTGSRIKGNRLVCIWSKEAKKSHWKQAHVIEKLPSPSQKVSHKDFVGHLASVSKLTISSQYFYIPYFVPWFCELTMMVLTGQYGPLYSGLLKWGNTFILVIQILTPVFGIWLSTVFNSHSSLFLFSLTSGKTDKKT